MEHQVETLIDGEPTVWSVEGDFAWGSGGTLCRLEDDPLLPALGDAGYRIEKLAPGTAEMIRDRIAALLGFESPEMLSRYHEGVDDAGHMRTIEMTRELRFRHLGLESGDFIKTFEDIVGVRLSAVLPLIGSDHVQVRINRPGTTDYNPPHRDGSLPVFENTLNIWIPVAEVDETTSLPIVPGSHGIPEADCWQTAPGGAVIRGRPYRVPAIARSRQGPLEMLRAPVKFGEALIFTPYLIHGLAINRKPDRTRMALELRFALAA